MTKKEEKHILRIIAAALHALILNHKWHGPTHCREIRRLKKELKKIAGKQTIEDFLEY